MQLMYKIDKSMCQITEYNPSISYEPQFKNTKIKFIMKGYFNKDINIFQAAMNLNCVFY